MTPPNVLRRRARPTPKSYLDAVSEIVANLQADHRLTDQELADRIGCSKSTIANARNKTNKLDGVTLASIEFEFGPGAINPFMQLGGSRAVPEEAHCSSDPNPCLPLVDALQVIIAAQAPGSDDGETITASEARADLAKFKAARLALDKLIALGSLPYIAGAA